MGTGVAMSPLKLLGHTPKLFPLKSSMAARPVEHIIQLLKVSADTKNLRIGKMIHAHLIITRQTTENNIVQVNSLVNLYAKCDQIMFARRLFDEMRKRNVVSWGALMAGYFHNGLVLEVLRLFKTMISEDYMCPNKYIFATVLSSCSDSGQVLAGWQCHGYALKSGLLFHQYVKNALICMYSRWSDVKGAMSVYYEVPGLDIFSYNIIINGLLENGYLSEAMDVLGRMVYDRIVWDNVSYVTAFGLCSRLKDLRSGMLIHCRMFKTGVKYDCFVGSAIIDMYGKCGNILNAREVFNRQQTKNVVSWTAILAAYFQNGSFEEALNLFLQMEADGLPPNEYTFAVLLNSCAGISKLGHGELLHACIKKFGFEDHTIVGNALINMYSKSGSIEAANKVFLEMDYRDSITWSSMICGLSHHGHGREALVVFQDMLAAKECPDYVTFVGVLSACAHLGSVQEGFYYLNQLMKQTGIEPGVEHYTCIVGLLCKAGRVDEAENFMKSIPVKWDVVAWRTLLSACLVHQKYGLGKKVAELVLQMDPGDVGTYILLSNMYAKAKRWDGVVKIRKLMKERNVKKEPGASWIEIRNSLHVFVSEGKTHPESSQIYEKVQELLTMIRLMGYVPDIGAVFHDVEDEQKQDYVSYHSEKLAIAYGLMKTPSGAPIRVIKNLRMCVDCHSAVKLISKMTNRVITVRDANRYHCFRDGCCSCADYW